MLFLVKRSVEKTSPLEMFLGSSVFDYLQLIVKDTKGSLEWNSILISISVPSLNSGILQTYLPFISGPKTIFSYGLLISIEI